jgi:flagellar basal-body rod modification protein FlgD
MAALNLVSQQDNSALVAQLNGKVTKPESNAQEINDRFLKLLIAQMNNQDPLNPLDNAQVTTQMAQISTVTGINSMADTVNQLMAQFSGMQTLQAAQLTGRSVLVSGNALTAGDGPATGGVQLPASVDRLSIEIRDANGQVVRTLDLGSKAQGLQSFTWDGLDGAGAAVAAGRYTFSAKALAGVQEFSVETLSAARVEGVRSNGGALQLIVSGIGPVAYSDIKQIL